MFHVTLQQGHAVSTMLGVAALALAAVWYFYRRTFRWLTGRQWWCLFAARAAAIVIVVLLLFRPVFSWEREVVEKSSLVFVVDSSASMSVADDASGTTRFEQARHRVLDWWTRLRNDFDLSLVEFSDTAHPLKSPDELAAVEPKGQATSLSRALQASTKQTRGTKTEAVILLSDGQHNSAGKPLKTAGSLGTVVHTVGVGSSLRDGSSWRDVRLTDLVCPEQLTLKNRAKLTAYVDAVGCADRLVKVTLEEDKKQVAETELVLDATEGAQEVALEFTPEQKGLHSYSARVQVLTDEKIRENNHRTTTALVSDARIRVLYIEGTLRAEYGALVGMFLSKDPNVEFCALVQTRPNVFSQRSNIEKLSLNSIPSDAESLNPFNVFLLGDIDSGYLKPQQMELIRQRVSEGAGLLMMGGYHSLGPGGYAGTPLEEVLPVQVGGREIGQVTEPFLPMLTPDGRRHPIFSGISGFFPNEAGAVEIAGLPALEGCVRVDRPRPAATVLAAHPTESVGDAKLPVLAVQPFGKGRTAVFTGDTTRNWQQSLRALDQQSPFVRFWGQLVRWLAGRAEDVAPEASVVANTDRAYYEPDSPLVLTALVRDKEGEGSHQAQVTASVMGKNNTAHGPSVTLAIVPGPAGHYRTEIEPLVPGQYEVLVTARLGDQELKSELIAIEVGRPNLEFDRLELNDSLLTALATESGGRYAHITTADRLIDGLERKQQKRHVELEVPLFSPPAFWLMFVVVLTTEWTLRRRYQLR